MNQIRHGEGVDGKEYAKRVRIEFDSRMTFDPDSTNLKNEKTVDYIQRPVGGSSSVLVWRWIVVEGKKRKEAEKEDVDV